MLPERARDFGDPAGVRQWICIPAYKETSLLKVYRSLQGCNIPVPFGIVFLFNAPESAGTAECSLNDAAFDELVQECTMQDPGFAVCLRTYKLPNKKAGVGLARKLAMDLACSLSNRPELTVILCLDADCEVAPNYLQAVHTYFVNHPGMQAASIYFEHRIPPDPALAAGIRAYEMHLRYLKNGLQWAGYPWYYHTVGSSMAVRVAAYLRSGGMNTRQAAEDFWFLQKLMPMGFGEILDTKVYPEARTSDRVPFGTGRSMGDFAISGELLSYDPHIFAALKDLMACMQKGLDPDWASRVHPELKAFCLSAKMDAAWAECRENSRDMASTSKRFWKWWSGIRGIHAVHWLRDRAFPNLPVERALADFLKMTGQTQVGDLLERMRQTDREGGIRP